MRIKATDSKGNILSVVDTETATRIDTPHYCEQCKHDMGYDWIIGPVCGDCCRKNHRRVMEVRS